jgi:ribosomal protein S10
LLLPYLNQYRANTSPFQASITWRYSSWFNLTPPSNMTQLNLTSKGALQKLTLLLLLRALIRTCKANARRIKTILLPPHSTTFTTTRAPIAHKSSSKEQYEIKFYPLLLILNCTSTSPLKVAPPLSSPLFPLISQMSHLNCLHGHDIY